MSDCIFCKIIAKQIPADVIYEDDGTLAFLDIQPVNVGHALIVPKRHYRDLSETPDDVVAKLMSVAKKVAAAARKATGAPAFNIGINTGPAAGQVVMHTHFHVMPRFENDGHRHWSKRDVTKEQMAKAAADMKAALAAK